MCVCVCVCVCMECLPTYMSFLSPFPLFVFFLFLFFFFFSFLFTHLSPPRPHPPIPTTFYPSFHSSLLISFFASRPNDPLHSFSSLSHSLSHHQPSHQGNPFYIFTPLLRRTQPGYLFLTLNSKHYPHPQPPFAIFLTPPFLPTSAILSIVPFVVAIHTKHITRTKT